MDNELDELRAEVAALRAEVVRRQGRDDRSVTRHRLLSGLAGMGAAGVASVAAAAPASAADGDPVLLGQTNTATSPTTISTNAGSDKSEVVFGGSGPWGIFATSDSTAVIGAVGPGGLIGVNGRRWTRPECSATQRDPAGSAW